MLAKNCIIAANASETLFKVLLEIWKKTVRAGECRAKLVKLLEALPSMVRNFADSSLFPGDCHDSNLSYSEPLGTWVVMDAGRFVRKERALEPRAVWDIMKKDLVKADKWDLLFRTRLQLLYSEVVDVSLHTGRTIVRSEALNAL